MQRSLVVVVERLEVNAWPVDKFFDDVDLALTGCIVKRGKPIQRCIDVCNTRSFHFGIKSLLQRLEISCFGGN